MKKPSTPRKQANDNQIALRQEAETELKRKYARVYDGEDGKAVLDHIVQQLCGYGNNIIRDSNPVSMYINAARHDIGNTVHKMIHDKVGD